MTLGQNNVMPAQAGIQ